MSKLIDKEEAIEALGARPISWTDSDYELGRQNQYDEDMTAILDISGIEAETVRHGLWKYVKKPLARGGYIDASECSVCHKIIFPYVNMNYCPYCGAKMEVDCSE